MHFLPVHNDMATATRTEMKWISFPELDLPAPTQKGTSSSHIVLFPARIISHPPSFSHPHILVLAFVPLVAYSIHIWHIAQKQINTLFISHVNCSRAKATQNERGNVRGLSIFISHFVYIPIRVGIFL